METETQKKVDYAKFSFFFQDDIGQPAHDFYSRTNSLSVGENCNDPVSLNRACKFIWINY